MARKAPKDTLLELDGPGVTPATVDSVALLRLADAFFRLTVKIAEASDLRLAFRGLRVLDKCCAVAATPTSQRAAQLAAPKAVRVVRGEDPVPVGAEGSAVEARRALRLLDPSTTASFGVGKRLQKISAPELPVTDAPWETIELRVMPLRVGGKDISAELRSLSEPEPFIVKVSTLDDARKLGAALKAEIDVRLEVCRDIDGRIERGHVVEVMPLEEGAVAEAWTSWFAEQTVDWDLVDSVGDELGRTH